jgi:hypothetical protein
MPDTQTKPRRQRKTTPFPWWYLIRHEIDGSVASIVYSYLIPNDAPLEHEIALEPPARALTGLKYCLSSTSSMVT